MLLDDLVNLSRASNNASSLGRPPCLHFPPYFLFSILYRSQHGYLQLFMLAPCTGGWINDTDENQEPVHIIVHIVPLLFLNLTITNWRLL